MPDGGTWDTNGFHLHPSGVISGSGTFSKDGDGILTLTGINTYSGGTLLNGGILKVSRDANLGRPPALSASAGDLAGRRRPDEFPDPGGAGQGRLRHGGNGSVFNGELFGYGTFTQKR